MPSSVAVAWVVPLEVVPGVNKLVPRTVAPELNVTTPVAGEPTPEALTVAVSIKDCAVRWAASAVEVGSWVIVKLIGVRSALELKLLSP